MECCWPLLLGRYDLYRMLLVQSIKSRKSLINPLNLLVLLMLSSCSTVASVYYASPGGEDCISCGLSESSPFLSLNYAVKFLNLGDPLYLMSGEYWEKKHTSNIPSGTRHEPIVIMAYKGHTPFILSPRDARYHFISIFTVD